MYLGLKGEARATIKEISDCYGISKNHLMKIVQDLSHEGILETVRGKSGGISLARPPEEICIGDIVRRTEPDFRIVECFGAGPPSCRLHGRSEEHTSELQSLMRISYAVFCLKK